MNPEDRLDEAIKQLRLAREDLDDSELCYRLAVSKQDARLVAARLRRYDE